MGIYAYCVVPSGHEPAPDLEGLGAARVAGRTIGELGVWVSEVDRLEPVIEHIEKHNAVVEAAVTQHITPVPLRFGQWAEAVEAIEAPIREKAAWYAERLVRFAGALEFGLRVVDPGKPERAQAVHVPPALTGREYMNALRETVGVARHQRQEDERVRAGIAEVMRDLVREERVEEARTPHGIVTVSHLVGREQFEEYRTRAQRLREQYPELRFLLSGPWVPYSFAT